MRIRSGLVASVMAAALAISAIPGAVLAAVDAFLEIDGIKGESSDIDHKGWIEVSSFSWGAGSAATIGSATGGAGSGRASVHDLTITKRTDSASPLLQLAAAHGKHISQVVLQMRKARGDPYMTYVLSDVLVSSVRFSGGGGDEVPTESVTFNFAKLEIKNQPAPGDRSRMMEPMGAMPMRGN